VWTDTALASYNKSSPCNIRGKSRQVEQEVKVGATQRNSYHPSEVNVLTTLETASGSGTLTPVSETENNDTNGNSTLPSNDVGYGAIVEPQNQVAACTQSSLMCQDRLQDGSWSPANEVVLKAAGSRPLICEDGEYSFDGRAPNPAINLITSSNQPRTFPDTETPPIIRNCATSDVAPGE